jgi:hypothetical protein
MGEVQIRSSGLSGYAALIRFSLTVFQVVNIVQCLKYYMKQP